MIRASAKRPASKASGRMTVLVLTAVAVACLALIEALHGHDCVGDGCVFCLVTGWAHAVLGLCVGITAARAVLSVFRGFTGSVTNVTFEPQIQALVPSEGIRNQLVPTPVSMGVRLLI